MSYTMTYAQGGLPAAADYIRSKGRNEDSLLVHMTPGEVQALQQMAVQHGGSLTINPQTGLPEAGILGNILKVAAPIALSYFGGPMLGASLAPGASVAMQTGLGMGLISGGLTALTTGSLEKGLTSGLTSGLIGGAMASFNPAAASASGAGTTVANTAVPAVEAAKAAQVAASQAPVSMMQNPSIINAGANPFGAQVATAQRAINAAAVNPAAATIANQAQAAANVPGVVNQATAQKGIFGTLGDKWNTLSTPAKFGVGAAGLGILGSMAQQPGVKVPVDKGTIRPYTYSANKVSPYPGAPAPGQSTSLYDDSGNAFLDKEEYRYYNPSYEELPTYAAAEGGVMQSYAQGGLAALSQGGMGNNMGYPQAKLDATQYATPSQMPTSAQVINADYEQTTDPYLGSPLKMANGGIARDSSPTGNMSFFNGVAPRITTPDPVVQPTQYSYDPKLQRYSIVQPPVSIENNAPKGVFETFLPGMFRTFGGNQMIPENYGAFSPLVDSLNRQQPQPQPQQNQFGNGLFGGMFSKIIPQLNSGDSSNQYQYDPQTQQYIKLAEGGDITAGYQGYGQNNQEGRNPLELLKALSAQQPEQPPTTVVRQAQGGLSTLGSYSDGGRMLKGPGDGMSDNIPGIIGGKQPARLADGEFVVPADVVSHLGNGSTDAGAKRLYSMMDKVRHARTGNKKQGKQIKADKYLPA